MQNIFLAIVALISTSLAHSKDRHFPPSFRWCVGISSHQHEGNNIHSDWWHFEKSRTDVPDSGIATDHWNRWREDYALAKKLGVSQFRMTLEWARIEPQEGKFDHIAINHYRNRVRHLLQLGIHPLITLHQLTLPHWFEKKGGFMWSGAPAAFARFAKLAAKDIAPEVDWWTTSVDGAVHLFIGHLSDRIPPAKNNIKTILPAMRGFLRSHAAAYHAIHEVRKKQGRRPHVGIVHFIRLFQAYKSWNPFDRVMAHFLNQIFNWSLSDSIHHGRLKLAIPFLLQIDEAIPGLKGTQDFIGINYYTRSPVSYNPLKDIATQIADSVTATFPGKETTDMGWEIYPEGMMKTLTEANRRYPDTPFYITEGGLADAKDEKRLKYTFDHLHQVWLAIQKGIPVKGYCHWSLTDNFEWLEGFGPRFGLWEIDYRTLERIQRPSVDAIIKLHRQNKLPAGEPNHQ